MSIGRRVGDWLGFNCGKVYCETNPRHVGRIEAIKNIAS
jgi:hypothetical protein